MALSTDLDWWRANRDSASGEELLALLERLRAWKAQHDQDRAQHPGPFLQMVWDGIFGDDDSRVQEAIQQIERQLERPRSS